MRQDHCRFCGKKLTDTFLDLGLSPLSNEYLSEENIHQGQHFYPLVVNVCSSCFLTQAEEYETPEHIFRSYQYFSSFSVSWLEHCRAYVDMIVPRLKLDTSSHVLEIACNDGYLLQYFLKYHIPVKGIDPAENVVVEARKKGIDVDCAFFNLKTAQEMASKGASFDLIIGNNVLAHVPNIRDFVAGLPAVLKATGTITMEFPLLMRLIENTQFDTIYHEHFSYLSLGTVHTIFETFGLKIYDVEELPTHGGSLRIYAAHTQDTSHPITERVTDLLQREAAFGLKNIETYHNFSQKVSKIKLDTLALLTSLKQAHKKIMAFGAAAKGNTFLNYCGIKRDMIDGVFDSNIHKQGLYLPGSLIPILSPSLLERERPDYLLILPWNLSEEITTAAHCIREWNGQFVTCIPDVKVF